VKPAWSCSRDPDLQFQGITCQGALSALVTVLVFKRLALHRNRTALHDPFAWPASSRNLSQNQTACQFTHQVLNNLEHIITALADDDELAHAEAVDKD
jgi:hypothetical protein